MSRIADDVAALPLEGEAGELVPLRDLWRDGTAVIAFLRHFG